MKVLKSLLYFVGFALMLAVAPTYAVDEYKLGPGDIVKITVYEHPDMTTETQLTGAGNVTFPLLGEVTVGGLSRSAAEAKLATLLKQGGYVEQPQVNISIMEYRSQQVSVLGQVSKPGKYPIDGPGAAVLDLISLAGGVGENGADYVTLIKHEGGKTVKYDIDLADLFHSASLKNNIQVSDGDIIYIPRAPVFYIYGEVQRSGAYRLERNMTVMQALSMGGGLSERGTERGLKINRRGADGQQQTLQVGLTDALQADDVVYVKESLF
ncbi:MAG: polysaccharide export protein EpsE [Pseudomonadota bacterium]